ncbi:MAG: iron donor protein CyaY [Gammaproteobacteria bacterium]|nr:MAG: iron donor protein CyaY [Gammaproteobacteria bacterium]
MNQPSFPVLAEQTLEAIQEQLEALDALEDADLDLIDGVLTIEFDDGRTLVLNRQEAQQQIWLVSPEGPAHFSLEDNRWVDDRTGEELKAVLTRVLSGISGREVSLD